jgi:hypothetical protein
MAVNGNGSGGDSLGYGVTDRGFITKPFQAILDEAFARAKQVFGPDVDLRSTSTIRKLLELTGLADAVLWMALDDLYQSQFVSSSAGIALDQLGRDLGLSRSYLPAAGLAKFTLNASAPKNAIFRLPAGTVIETDPPVAGAEPFRFQLLTALTLVKRDPPDGSETANASVAALTPGPAGNLAVKQLRRINATYAARYLNFDPTQIDVSNDNPFSGGEVSEDDSTYRRKLYSWPRSVWTVDAVRATVLALDGVRDAQVYDPYGGLDRSAPLFGQMCYSDAFFQAPRDLSNPYYFTITVAPKPGVLWDGDAQIQGLREQILDVLQPIRPVSIFPTLERADSVEIALRAHLILQPGADPDVVLAAAREAISAYIGTLRLGDAVLYAQILRILAETPGIRDVQDLRLRRSPPVLGLIVFGTPAQFGNATDLSQIEASCGANINLAPREVAVFSGDSPLMDMEVGTS